MPQTIHLNDFAKIAAGLLVTDRHILAVADGDTGEGKSCFTSQFCRAVAQYSNTPFSYKDNMTFSREELTKWIDGDKKGLHQKPEYTAVLADELISMFFKRNWYDMAQIDGVELLNKCRDRHLLIAGNIPNFWDLDAGVLPLVRYWIHIHERGRAWIYEKTRNAHSRDKWNRVYNEKLYDKEGNPFNQKGFLCEVIFNDWAPEEKRNYYLIRNQKRKKTEGQRLRFEKWGRIKKQRDALIRALKDKVPKITNKEIAQIAQLDHTSIDGIVSLKVLKDE